LYVKAAEQLGSDKAPVRLAGLYALERLAQDNPVHRQSIVEVICAYLRMPYTPSAEKQVDRSIAEPTDTAETPNPDQPTQPDPREERQVRLAAQRILARHLRPTTPDRTPSLIYWDGMTVDLTEAALLDANFNSCSLNDTGFDRATFTGTARFDGVTFTRTARFDRVTFGSDAGFHEATFTGGVNFGDATFESRVALYGARVGDGNRDRDVWPAGWGVDPDTRRVVRVLVSEKPEGDAEPE
jgi:hypothetical protein